jgi:SNF2 family DNA or RNA helicase
MIKGQQTTEEIRKTTQGFQRDRSVRKALVYTIKSGASFTAHSASTAFFVGYEWSAIDNLQAEDRIHRLGQTDPVNIYYFMHKNTIVDDMVMQKLDDKQMAANWILRPDEVLTEIKKILR